MSHWAIDLGTTNTGIARWDGQAHRPVLLEIPEICRQPGGEDPLEAPRLIPSATQMLEQQGFESWFGNLPLIAKNFFIGRHAEIGRLALERNRGSISPGYVSSFKRYLGREAMRPIGRIKDHQWTAREVASAFTRELLSYVKLQTGERVRDVVFTTPVDAYESYRAELMRLGRRLGIKKIRFIDEPVAAALGYGLNVQRERLVLVVDFGGGTLDFALVALTGRSVEAGTGKVLAKEGRALGGNHVDRWLLEEFCERLEYPLREDSANEQIAFWYRLMLNEAKRVKETVFFKDSGTFYLTPPDELRHFEARIQREDSNILEVGRDEVIKILERNKLYKELQDCVDSIREQANRQDLSFEDIDEVLMVGGSTLLPGVYPLFEKTFGRDRVRAWQPFEAVAYGACAYAANSFQQSDFIVHDYAIRTYDAQTHEPQYTVIVPKGTRIPTLSSFWERQFVPTCSLGEPETLFKLVICEIGRYDEGERRFSWDSAGTLHKLGGKQEAKDGQLVVPLNEDNPTLGFLKPPHMPSDRKPRLRITFGVNADRWLVSSVLDLKTKKQLMQDEPVIRLL